MKYNSFAIMGPTCIGKTATTIALSKIINGCLIAADSFQFYEGVNVGGWKQYEKEFDGVPRLLYNSRPLDSPIISYKEFYEQAGWARDKALSLDMTPLFEGCHSGFARHLAGTKRPPGNKHGLIGVIVLMPHESTTYKALQKKVRGRVEEYIQKGVLDETRDLLEAGGQDTVPLRGWFFRYFGNHLMGQINLDEAINSTYIEWMKCLDKQLQQFRTIKNAHTLYVDTDCQESIERSVTEFVLANIDEKNLEFMMTRLN